MEFEDEIVNLMYLIDFDEEIVDSQLKELMRQSELDINALKMILRLVQFKRLKHFREQTDCNNDEEYNFIETLLNNLDTANETETRDIIKNVLLLDTLAVSRKSEQLLHLILPEIVDNKTVGELGNYNSKPMLYLKVCDAVLDAVVESKETINFEFRQFETILNVADDLLDTHFCMHTVPKLYHANNDSKILFRIWEYMKLLPNKINALKILSFLLNHYLPLSDKSYLGVTKEFTLKEYLFWDIVLVGLKAVHRQHREMSIKIAKKAIDLIISLDKNVSVSRDGFKIFVWTVEVEKILKTAWDKFFILLESLEEGQSNIVLPNLQFFDNLINFGNHWLEAAFKIGLRHDDILVKNKCIDYRLQIGLGTESEVQTLLEALNNINVFDCPKESDQLINKIMNVFAENHNFLLFFKAISTIRWSTVPFFYITLVLRNIKIQEISAIIDRHCFINTINVLIKITCNNVLIKKAAEINIAYFIVKYCNELQWTAYTEFCFLFQLESFSVKILEDKPVSMLVNKLKFKEVEKMALFEIISQSHDNINFGILYLNSHKQDAAIFIDIISEKVHSIKSTLCRSNCNLHESFNDVVYLMNLLSKTDAKQIDLTQCIKKFILSHYTAIVQYLLHLLISETVLSCNDVALLFQNKFKIDVLTDDVVEILLQLFLRCKLLLKDKNTSFEKKYLSISIMNYLIIDYLDENDKLLEYSNKYFNFNIILNITRHFPKNNEVTSTQKNILFGHTCELVYKLVKRNNPYYVKEIIFFIREVLNSGNLECLKFVLMIINELLPKLIDHEPQSYFNLGIFLNRMWKELEEIKLNSQYTAGMEYFINVITNEVLLNFPTHLDIIALYYDKILGLAPARKAPLLLLTDRLSKIVVNPHERLMTVIFKILLHNPISENDQRITENVETMVICDPIYELEKSVNLIYHDFHIQHLAALKFCSILHADTMEKNIMSLKNKISDSLRRNINYHRNSESHRTLFRAMQHLLMAVVKFPFKNDMHLVWCFDMLSRYNHQPSVRICLEWCLTLCLYLKNVTITEKILKVINSWRIPIQSQLTILYWLIKHKVLVVKCTKKEFELVTDTFMFHTMGHSYNIRLQAQYYITKLCETNLGHRTKKYDSTIKIIKKTFAEIHRDKCFKRMNEDYFANSFDIVSNLTPFFVYVKLPNYDIVNKNIKNDLQISSTMIRDMEINLGKSDAHDFKTEWIGLKISDDLLKDLEFKHGSDASQESVVAIRKKYNPHKDMLEDLGTKKQQSGLIVVASLMENSPKLDEIAKTSELFRAKTYVISNLRHLKDKKLPQFSWYSETMMDIQAVQPGLQLKQYLIKMKADGYFVIAPVQTSGNCKLAQFQFPMKTLLLLGHETDGIPFDYLPIVDYCVDIPQKVLDQTLDVHVIASIFIWEHSKQNVFLTS